MRKNPDKSKDADLIFRAMRCLNLVGVLTSQVVVWDAQASEAPVAARLARGHAIAQAHCSPCHAIGKRDPSPTRVNENTAFRDLYRRYPIAMLLRALKTGTIEGHDEMPAFDLPSTAMTDLLAYIDSLGPLKASKYVGTFPQEQKPER